MDLLQYDSIIEKLLEQPGLIADILPEQVPADAGGQYYKVERYFRHPKQMSELRRKFAEILLRLNCYADMAVTFDWGEHWETNPAPESFVTRVSDADESTFVRALFADQKLMIDIDGGDTWMTVYSSESPLFMMARKLAAAGGLFTWQQPAEPLVRRLPRGCSPGSSQQSR